MAFKWAGTVDRLKQAVTFIGRVGEWRDHDDAVVFRGTNGEILNFWPKTNTVQFQGKGIDSLEDELKSELGLKKNTLDL